MDVDNAGRPVGFLLFVRKVVRFQVAMVEDDHPPIMDSISGKNINWAWALIFQVSLIYIRLFFNRAIN